MPGTRTAAELVGLLRTTPAGLQNDPVDLSLGEPVLWLYTDLGTSAFLRGDGSVLIEDVLGRAPTYRDATADERRTALVLGALQYQHQDCSSCCQARPRQPLRCEHCGGARVDVLERDRVVCRVCGARVAVSRQ